MLYSTTYCSKLPHQRTGLPPIRKLLYPYRAHTVVAASPTCTALFEEAVELAQAWSSGSLLSALQQ